MNALKHLADIGVTFGTIIDVGTHAETPELRAMFPNQKHLLFEPAEEFFPKIAVNYAGMNYELFPLAVSDSDGEGKLKKIAISGDEISHSTLSSEDVTANLTNVCTARLDTLLRDRNDPQPYLLKIDVDGFEMPILRGVDGIWDRVDCVIIEATMETFAERLSFIQQRNFRIFDIVDQCYYSGVFSQADLVMVSDRLVKQHSRLRPWETEEFAWEKWVPVPSYEAVVQSSFGVEKND
ncbi:FkbM family methyltransferase [Methylobacterium nodulans]|nr:FkbM family methyltransferase [Methylobacterium nodulans]